MLYSQQKTSIFCLLSPFHFPTSPHPASTQPPSMVPPPWYSRTGPCEATWVPSLQPELQVICFPKELRECRAWGARVLEQIVGFNRQIGPWYRVFWFEFSPLYYNRKVTILKETITSCIFVSQQEKKSWFPPAWCVTPLPLPSNRRQRSRISKVVYILEGDKWHTEFWVGCWVSCFGWIWFSFLSFSSQGSGSGPIKPYKNHLCISCILVSFKESL